MKIILECNYKDELVEGVDLLSLLQQKMSKVNGLTITNIYTEYSDIEKPAAKKERMILEQKQPKIIKEDKKVDNSINGYYPYDDIQNMPSF